MAGEERRKKRKVVFRRVAVAYVISGVALGILSGSLEPSPLTTMITGILPWLYAPLSFLIVFAIVFAGLLGFSPGGSASLRAPGIFPRGRSGRRTR